MIRAGISIPDLSGGDVFDTYDKFGFIYISSDNILSAAVKGFESTSYPEEEGEHILPKTVDNAFEYNVVFLIEAVNGSLTSANAKIKEFNECLFTQDDDSDIKTFKEITLYNYYKRVKIVGYPTPISNATSLWRDSKGQELDAVQVQLTIRVHKPSLCDFNYYSE